MILFKAFAIDIGLILLIEIPLTPLTKISFMPGLSEVNTKQPDA